MMTRMCACSASAALIVCAATSMNACAPTAGPTSGVNTGPGMEGTSTTGPLNRPAGVSQTIQVTAGVLPLGSVPYDNLALPLLSPDGRFVAVQTGAPPTWPTVLAEWKAEIPVATRIEIYELDQREGIAAQDRRPPMLAAALDGPLILGRFSDDEGFLVESQQEDGSRWIGKAAWTTPQIGEVTWLVEDQNVNAFAAIGADGRLAWCRRAIDATAFELVIRLRGNEFVVPPPSLLLDSEDTVQPLEGWFMPTWSGRGDTLFAVHLNRGDLEMRHLIASSSAAVHQSMRRLVLATDCDIHTAYQTMSSQSSAVLALPSALTSDQIVFFHPALRRVALWRPLALPERQRLQLNAFSIAALVDQDDYAFVSTTNSGGHLIRQNLRVPAERLNLVAGLHIPRQTTSATWPFILLSPGEGQIGLMAMRLLPRGESMFSPN